MTALRLDYIPALSCCFGVRLLLGSSVDAFLHCVDCSRPWVGSAFLPFFVASCLATRTWALAWSCWSLRCRRRPWTTLSRKVCTARATLSGNIRVQLVFGLLGPCIPVVLDSMAPTWISILLLGHSYVVPRPSHRSPRIAWCSPRLLIDSTTPSRSILIATLYFIFLLACVAYAAARYSLMAIRALQHLFWIIVG